MLRLRTQNSYMPANNAGFSCSSRCQLSRLSIRGSSANRCRYKLAAQRFLGLAGFADTALQAGQCEQSFEIVGCLVQRAPDMDQRRTGVAAGTQYGRHQTIGGRVCGLLGQDLGAKTARLPGLTLLVTSDRPVEFLLRQDWAWSGRRAGITAARVTGLANHDPAQAGEIADQPLPDPARQVFASWIFQTRDVVEIMVIELIEQGLERFFEIGEIHDPAAVATGIAGHVHFDPERMPVQAAALVIFGHVWQTMRRFNLKALEDFHARSLIENASRASANFAYD